MRAVLSVAPLLVGAALVACASDPVMEAEMSRLRRDLHGLKKEVQTQRLEIERLSGRVTLLSVAEPPRAEPVAPVTEVAAAANVRPSAGRNRLLPVVRLKSKADPTAVGSDDDGDWQNPGAQDDGSPPVVITLGTPNTPKLKVDHDVLKRPDPVLSKTNVRRAKETTAVVPAPKQPKPEPTAKRIKKRQASRAEIREAYDAALAKLRDQKDTRAALEGFETFVASFKTNRLTDNAIYWAGECHRLLDQWDDAAKAFAELLRSHPRSAKVPYAKVGLGQSQIELGNRAAGEALLREVIEKYPTSEAAREAKGILSAGGQ